MDLTKIIKEAEAGDSWAQYEMGMDYWLNSTSIEERVAKAIPWFKKSADNGNHYAAETLSKIYAQGYEVKKDDVLAFKYGLVAANGGLPESMYQTAVCYEKGVGVNQDMKKAEYWYLESVYNGYSDAKYSVGMLCLYNEEVYNPAKGFYWMNESAESGYSNAIVQVGLCYEKGLGVASDLDLAFASFKKAVQKGNLNGMYELGRCYQEGIGVAVDCTTAFTWYKKCFEKGLEEKSTDDYGPSQSAYQMGNCLEYGEGVEVDYGLALYYYMKADDDGVPGANEGMERCGEKMKTVNK